MSITKDNSLRRFASRGRLLMVGTTQWRWRCGDGGHVIAYSEHGERRLAGAWTILGMSSDTFKRGQWKKTSDGIVGPGDVAKWILNQNTKVSP